MQMIKQGGKTIEEYGRELEELFVNLTISQANGNSEAYKILKPLNEKQAISRFTDGLRSDKLSTIIAARGYTSLKDAIQAAKDEQTTMTPSTSTSEVVFYGRRGYFRPTQRNFTNTRPRQFENSSVPRFNTQYNNGRYYSNRNYRDTNRNYRDNKDMRSKSATRKTSHRVNMAEQVDNNNSEDSNEESTEESTEESKELNINNFFRD